MSSLRASRECLKKFQVKFPIATSYLETNKVDFLFGHLSGIRLAWGCSHSLFQGTLTIPLSRFS